MHRPVDEHAPHIYTTPVYFTVQSAGLMNSIFVPSEEALFISPFSPAQNLTGATLDLTGAAAPVSFTGAFGTIFLSPTHSRRAPFYPGTGSRFTAAGTKYVS